ncbi:hypothetical protein GOP47_0029871 [Adiantum capillus-veneris]|nr:hypothetical protein GOP47_0029871 [Adiantum capillus-veneris]
MKFSVSSFRTNSHVCEVVSISCTRHQIPPTHHSYLLPQPRHTALLLATKLLDLLLSELRNQCGSDCQGMQGQGHEGSLSLFINTLGVFLVRLQFGNEGLLETGALVELPKKAFLPSFYRCLMATGGYWCGERVIDR